MAISETDLDLGNSYEIYRRVMEDPDRRTQGMETEGLAKEQFAPALLDPRSAILKSKGSRIAMPLVVPIDYMPWMNQTYLLQKSQGDSNHDFELYYYNHMSFRLRGDRTAYTTAMKPVLERISDGRGALAVEHVYSDGAIHDEDINYLAGRLGLTATDVLAKEEVPVRHYQYASLMTPKDPERAALKPLSLIDGYKKALKDGIVSDNNVVTVHQRLTKKDANHIWNFYSSAFKQLDNTDPIITGFDEDQFHEIMQDDRFMKVVHRLGNTSIANMALLGELEACPWMNAAYYRKYFPDYEVVVSPGLIANAAYSGKLSMGTVGMVRRLFEFAGGKRVLTFVCDEISNRQVPALSHAVLNRSRELSTDFSNPLAYQLFRLFQFEHSAIARV